uniref:Uncharacterized protein n=1 Tax=Panagrolaimus sp. JU765 TaxID=591449 RepID=A0AC34R747_9BILA
MKIQALGINDLRERQSRSTETNLDESAPISFAHARVRPSTNALLLDLFQRIVSAGTLALIRPAEPLSSNENTMRWEKLGWSW